MKVTRSTLLAILLVATLTVTAHAAPSVGALGTDPGSVTVAVPTTLRVTVEITDPSVMSVVLQRVSATGALANIGTMVDNGTAGDLVAGDRVFTRRVSVTEAQTGVIRLRVSAAFRGVARRILSAELGVPVGQVLDPDPNTGGNPGTTIQGAAGTVLEIQPNSLDVQVLAGIAPAPPGTIVAPTGNLGLVNTVDIVLEPTEFTGLLIAPSQPLDVTVPAPAGTADGTLFIVAQQATVDAADGSGLVPRLVASAAAISAGGQIVTATGVPANPLPGVRFPGAYAVVTATGSGFVTGIVSDAGGPVAGAVVSSNTNPLVDFTDANGRYNLFVSGGPFTVTAFQALRGARGVTSGTIAAHGSTVQADITLTPLTVPVVARDGIRNAGFERCVEAAIDPVGNLAGTWGAAGDARAVQSFGPTSSGHVIRPTEGKCMANISTGSASVGQAGSTLAQKFRVPAGVRTLTFDYNFVSEEFDEFVGSAFNDSFQAVITIFSGTTETVVAQFVVARTEINDFSAGGFTMIGDCFFPGGDSTCGEVGWRTASIDLSAYASELNPITAEVAFSVTDRGDNIYDTHVFIDNIRFGTLWVDAKIISPSTATLARVERDVRQASEMLSQAGLIVRLRDRAPASVNIADPGGLDEVNLTFLEYPGVTCANVQQLAGMLTTEASLGMSLSRSAVPTDVNAHYVSRSNRSVAGYAIGPDEFCTDVVLLDGGGLFVTDAGTAILRVLPHELAHLLISPANARSTVEHGTNDPMNLMYGSGALADPAVSRAQSANINRANAPLIQP